MQLFLEAGFEPEIIHTSLCQHWRSHDEKWTGNLQSYVIKIYRSPALMFFFAEDVGIKAQLKSEL
jgi:hypothetical protein